MLTERKLEVIAWDTPGTIVEGRLLKMDKVKYDDGVGVKYVVRARDGKIHAFRGATQLDMCLHVGDVGKIIEITYQGTDATKEVRPGFNAPKLFIVRVDDSSLPPAAGGDQGITDDDIPF